MAVTTNQGLILPDGTDNANVPLTFTDFVTTPVSGMENRLVQRYLSVADRTARNGAPNEGELSYLTDTNLLQFYNGAAWQTIVSDQHQAQEVVLSFGPATSFTTPIVFPVAFTLAPNVHTNINNATGSTAGWQSRAFGTTNTGFTLFVFTTGAASTWTNVAVQWSAFVRT
jgi:hypothetical protein